MWTIAWGLLTGAASRIIPWAGPRFTLGLAGTVLVVMLLGSVFLSGVFYGAGGKRDALAARDAEWELRIRAKADEQRADMQRRIDEAVAAANQVAAQDSELAHQVGRSVGTGPVSTSPDAVDPVVDRLCKQSRACRDRAGPRK